MMLFPPLATMGDNSGRTLARIEQDICIELTEIGTRVQLVHNLLHEARPHFDTVAKHKAWAMRTFNWGRGRYYQLMAPPEAEIKRLEDNRRKYRDRDDLVASAVGRLNALWREMNQEQRNKLIEVMTKALGADMSGRRHR